VAGLGALLAARLASELSERLGAAASQVDQDRLLEGGSAIPADLVAATQHALADSLHSVFLALIPVAVLGLLLAFRLEELPLRSESAQAEAEAASA
jgi:hypothetical protein